MKCVAFMGQGWAAVRDYNNWAQGKPLTKDVVIRTHELIHPSESIIPDGILILVFFDEAIHPSW